jgi:signal transduction histidine kinase
VHATLDLDVDELDVACPASLLHLITVNLVGNALKFLDACPVRRVFVSAHGFEGWAELVVQDSGPGIPHDSLERIFEPFYRVPGGSAPGTGIGLATVRRIVDAHGGSVEVHSEMGRGTTFRVRIPAVREVEPLRAGAPRAASVAL